MKYFLAILVFIFYFSKLNAQVDNDIQLIQNRKFYSEENFNYYQGQHNSQQIMQTGKKSFLQKINPVTLVLKGAMYAYQNCLSQQLSKQCPYEITCSNFAKLSIKDLGLIKGLVVSADRILRCNRISILDYFSLDINEETGKIEDSPWKYK